MPERDNGATIKPRTSRPTIDPVAGLAGSIAHDFSNLLMIIRTAGEFLHEDLDENDPRQKYVRMLLHAADRGVRLTSQLQAFGRSQLLNPEIVRPAHVVREMADTLRHLVPEDVDFRISVRASDAAVSFDVAQLQVVVMHLVGCAAERVRAHGRLLLSVTEDSFEELRLGTDQVISGRFVSIVVAKTGDGLDDHEQKRFFEPRLTGKNLPRGTDLRLASVHGVVTQSGGFVDVSSEKGRGTMFRVFLPVAAQEPRKSAELTHIHVHRDVTGSEVILVVEDDKEVRRTVCEALERYGYTVYEAADGAEALHITAMFNTTPDLLLTDLVMPEVTGRELIEGLAQVGRLPKVLMMSGYTDDEVLRRARPTQSYPFIKKPFTVEELATKVRETLSA
jgi:two-component system cell cycle sensor histidine kinase/response regulator CckA